MAIAATVVRERIVGTTALPLPGRMVILEICKEPRWRGAHPVLGCAVELRQTWTLVSDADVSLPRTVDEIIKQGWKLEGERNHVGYITSPEGGWPTLEFEETFGNGNDDVQRVVLCTWPPEEDEAQFAKMFDLMEAARNLA